MTTRRDERPLESGIRRDLRGDLTYADYLRLDLLLAAQQPLSRHHDELLFIIQHQTSELWMRLLIHELASACRNLAADRTNSALKDLARVKHIQRQLFEQWAVLETLTPSEYADFRDVLSQASGFQSLQYRLIEFTLGNKSPEMLEVFAYAAEDQQRLREALLAPSLYDQTLRLLARRGFAIPPDRVERDWSRPLEPDPRLVEAFKGIYEARERHWEEYELCEELVDIEESFQLWRFRHLKTVERIIGGKEGTGGSSGTEFLRAALDLRFFPELWDVRTEIGR
ncbi:MAG: tryptophan 2,3-dioxygenase [Thermoleophilaceae bacterium]